MNSQKRDKKEVPNSPDRTFDRRSFLKVAGAGLVAGLVSLTGLKALAEEPKPVPDKGKLVAQADPKKGPLLAQNEAGGKAVAAPKLAELEGIALSELQDLAAKSGHAVIHDVVTDKGHFLTYHVSIDGQLVSIFVNVEWANEAKRSVGIAMNGRIVGGGALDELTRLCNEEGHPFRYAKMFLDIYPAKDKRKGTMIDVYVVPVDSQHGDMVQGRPLALLPFAVGTQTAQGTSLFRID